MAEYANLLNSERPHTPGSHQMPPPPPFLMPRLRMDDLELDLAPSAGRSSLMDPIIQALSALSPDAADSRPADAADSRPAGEASACGERSAHTVRAGIHTMAVDDFIEQLFDHLESIDDVLNAISGNLTRLPSTFGINRRGSNAPAATSVAPRDVTKPRKRCSSAPTATSSALRNVTGRIRSSSSTPAAASSAPRDVTGRNRRNSSSNTLAAASSAPRNVTEPRQRRNSDPTASSSAPRDVTETQHDQA